MTFGLGKNLLNDVCFIFKPDPITKSSFGHLSQVSSLAFPKLPAFTTQRLWSCLFRNIRLLLSPQCRQFAR